MPNRFQNAVDRTKKFVKEHPTVSACAVTAVVGYKFGYRSGINLVVNETVEQSYAWGHQTGVLALQNTIMLDFITARGLNESLTDFVLGLKDVEVDVDLQRR